MINEHLVLFEILLAVFTIAVIIYNVNKVFKDDAKTKTKEEIKEKYQKKATDMVNNDPLLKVMFSKKDRKNMIDDLKDKGEK